jgi:hypothetical protein
MAALVAGAIMFFSKKAEWEETFRVNAIGRAGRGICGVMFWLWGLGGLALIGSEFMSVPSGVGVGTSSYIAAQSVYWLGGMVLFGLGALIDTQDFSGVRPKPKDDYGDVRLSQ